MRLFIIILLLSTTFCYTQKLQDTIYDLNDLPEFSEELLEEDFEYESNIGWFPVPNATYFSYGIGASLPFFMYETEGNIVSRSFNNPVSYTGAFQLSDKEREVTKKYSKDDEDDYPEKSLEEFSIITKLAIKNFTTLRFDVSFHILDGLIMSDPVYKNFYSLKNREYRKAKEVSVIKNTDYGLNFKLAAQIPIWGANMSTGHYEESYYYLLLGYSYSRILYSKNKQFFQLGNNNGELRYRNGKDTIGINTSKTLSTLNYNRHYLEFGIGADMNVVVAGSHLGFSMELDYSFALSSVIKDDMWRQQMLRLQIQLYLQGFIRELIFK